MTASNRTDPHDALSAVSYSATNSARLGTAQDLTKITLNSDELKDRAVGLASGKDAAEFDELLRYLVDPVFLTRLDSPEEYQGSYATLRLSQVVKRLAENPSSNARGVLTALTDSPEFTGHILRLQLLIRALAKLDQPGPMVVGFWDKFSKPESPIAFDVIEALCVNQSAPAMELLERKFADTNQVQSQCLAWMRQIILPRRNDEALLSGCEHMLTHSLPIKLKPLLVEALFDYRPEWYVGDDPPRPPSRAASSKSARQTLARIAAYAQSQPWLDSEQRTTIKKVISDLRN